MQEMRKVWLGRRLLTGLMGALVIGAVSLGVAPAALAQEGSVGAAVAPAFAASVTVGAQNVPVLLSVRIGRRASSPTTRSASMTSR